MPNKLLNLSTPFFVLAPMDDVTDTVFRQLVAEWAAPDLYFTEFVNVDGLQSPGRDRLLKKLRFTPKEKPLIAQIWGKNPENYYKTCQELAEQGYAGIDINMGCPEKTVIKNGCCSALINNRELAAEIIQAAREGCTPLPLSVKTRIGFDHIDLSWPEFLLKQKLNMLTIHGRTKKEMSNVPCRWDVIGQIRELRDQHSPDTLLVGNGDVMNRQQGLTLAQKYKLDGVMIGRGVFQDPFVFAKDSHWETASKEEKIGLYRQHVELFARTWQPGERNIRTLNRFCKVYIQGFDGAKELRETLMLADSTDMLLRNLTVAIN